ncbi:MAG: hypothetical protein HY660_11685 [Armatimonadetes bacterium]|nr:hypothetical protein [Armatimonadota bacterium]
MAETGGDAAPQARLPLAAPTGQVLPDLRLASAESVRLHEESDPRRAAALTERLRRDGLLRNPPIAAPAGDGTYVVLDGANRVTALRALAYPYQILQVVDYESPAVVLDVWHHLLMDADSAAMLERISAAADVPVQRAAREEARDRLAHREAVGVLDDGGPEVVILEAAGGLAEDVLTLARAVAAYKGSAQIYRVLEDDPQAVRRTYGVAGLLVRFPRFTKVEILAVGRGGVRLPAGVTRHVIPGRALHVNLDLAMLHADASLDEKNARLAEMIHARLLNHRVRHYPEATFLFDE